MCECEYVYLLLKKRVFGLTNATNGFSLILFICNDFMISWFHWCLRLATEGRKYVSFFFFFLSVLNLGKLCFDATINNLQIYSKIIGRSYFSQTLHRSMYTVVAWYNLNSLIKSIKTENHVSVEENILCMFQHNRHLLART